jgi:hypothetical protein
MNVEVRKTDFPIMSDDWVRWRVDNPDVIGWRGPNPFTFEMDGLLEGIREIVQTYNYDDSDSMSDYYRVNFGFSRANIDQEFSYEQEIETAKRLGLPTDVFDAEWEEHLECLRMLGKA